MARNGCAIEMTVGTVVVIGCNGPFVKVAAVSTGVVVIVSTGIFASVDRIVVEVLGVDTIAVEVLGCETTAVEVLGDDKIVVGVLMAVWCVFVVLDEGVLSVIAASV